MAQEGFSGSHAEDVVCEGSLVNVGGDDVKGDRAAWATFRKVGIICLVEVCRMKLMEYRLIRGG